MKKDEIRIENLEVYAYHGVFPKENEKGQPFFVNMTLYTDTKRAGKNDNLTDSTHYGEVCHSVSNYMKENTFQLIERVAEGVAREVLRNYPLVESLEVEIRKPEAPIGLPFESVSVKIHRGWHVAYVAIGSNMGERESYIEKAIKALGDQAECMLEKVSNIIQTTPYGVTDQAEFLNGAMKLKTLLQPEELLDVLQGIEKEAKRERNLRWGPRTLDLDIIFYDEEIYQSERLIIPHVDMQNRDFVLKPLTELNAHYRHPILHKTTAQLLEALQAKKKHVIDF